MWTSVSPWLKERVEVIRNKEVGIIWESQKVSAMFGVALFSTPVFIAVCSLGSFSLAGNTLTASKAGAYSRSHFRST
jgi:ATP-binding cassette subfamily C (CFTR/MRP) protein 1